MNESKIGNQKTIRKRFGTIAVGILLVAAMFASMVMPVQALTDLKATNENIAYMGLFSEGGLYGSAAWFSYGVGTNPYLLKYSYGDMLNTYGSGKTPVTVGTQTAIKIGDGQCVAFAKAMSNTNNIASTNWRRGNHVLDGGVTRGTIIAKFNADGTYDSWGGTGHVAIFDKYFYVQGIPYGIYVWDQNYVSPYLTGKHVLLQSSSGVNNADNYYVVQE